MTTNAELKSLMAVLQIGVDKLSRDGTQNKVEHAEMDGRMKLLEKGVELAEKHNTTLYGNGEEGVISIIKYVNKTLNRWDKFAWIVIAAIVTLVISTAYYIFIN